MNNNFNLGELERLFQSIESIINELESKHYFTKYTKLFLASGNNLVLNITKSSIPHLLGININYLQSLNIYREKNSYELLKLLCNDAYKINSLKNQGIIDYNNLFSKNILEKINGFWTNIEFNDTGVKNTELVCKYDSSRNYLSGQLNERFDYAIIKNLFGKYYVLWVVKSDDFNNEYIPMSNRVFNCYDDMIELLNKTVANQEITFLSGAQLDNNKPYNIEDILRMQKISNLKEYKNSFGCSIDLTRECIKLLSNTKHHKELATDKYNDGCVIIDAIQKGTPVNTDLLCDEKFIDISNAFNDFLFGSQLSDNSNSVSEKYSSLINKLNRFKSEILEYKKQIEDQNSEIQQLNDTNKYLTERNEELETANEKVFEIINSIKK